MGAPPGDCDDWMNPLPSMSSRNLQGDRALCQRVGRCGYEEASGHSRGEFHDQTRDEEACSQPLLMRTHQKSPCRPQGQRWRRALPRWWEGAQSAEWTLE